MYSLGTMKLHFRSKQRLRIYFHFILQHFLHEAAGKQKKGKINP